jgi:hypothetical protein
MELQRNSQSSGDDIERPETITGRSARPIESVPPVAEKIAEPDSPAVSDQDTEKAKQLAENLEKVLALNLDNSGLGGSRLSRPVLQLVSALTGLAALFLMYCCTRLIY